jgi:hypothetical protein
VTFGNMPPPVQRIIYCSIYRDLCNLTITYPSSLSDSFFLSESSHCTETALQGGAYDYANSCVSLTIYRLKHVIRISVTVT